jgi:hypothetical protein
MQIVYCLLVASIFIVPAQGQAYGGAPANDARGYGANMDIGTGISKHYRHFFCQTTLFLTNVHIKIIKTFQIFCPGLQKGAVML